MRRAIYIAAVAVLGATACTLAVAVRTIDGRKARTAAAEREQWERSALDLQGQIRQIKSQKDSAEQKVRRLENAVALSSEKRNQDQQVIKDLWALLAVGTPREQEASAGESKAAHRVENGEGSAPPDERKDAKHDSDAMKGLLASSAGDLDAAVHRIMTAEAIDRTLQEHAGQPAYWVAAASLASNPERALEYLKEAAQLHPDNSAVLSALVSAQMAAGRIDESTLAYASELARLDPTNALGDLYAAQFQFQSGDIPGALQSLAQAGAKGRFSDDRISMLMARRDYFLDEGVSDSAALGLSAFTLPLEHLAVVRQLGDQSIQQARSFSAAGRMDDALKIAQDVSNIGRTVSSSGRFLIHDRVGVALQQAGLTEQRQIYEAMGDIARIQEVDARLQAVQKQSATIDVMARSFDSVMADMTDEDVAAYVDGTILNGEFATLQSLPQVAQALQQVQTSTAVAPDQTKPPKKQR